MKKIQNKSNNIEEDKIEKELLKKLEKNIEGNQNNGIKEDEIKYEQEYISNSDNNKISNIDDHFNIAIDSKIIKSNSIYNKKINLYNEKLGVYQYLYNDNIFPSSRKFHKSSKISKYLLDKEESINNILSSESNEESLLLKNLNKIDLNFSENFNYRLFKYLDSYSDIYLTSSDLFLRQKIMNMYIFHILNHMMKRKEEIEVNNRIEKLIERKTIKSNDNLKNGNFIIKDELFINEDEEFLKQYKKESEITNFAEGKEEFFEEFRMKENLKNNLDYSEEDYNLIKDQGFTSPRVLILVPNKKHARLIVEEIINILRKGNWKGVSNKKKFKEEFSEMESMGDCFRLGISFEYFNNKLRLYQSFDTSDIIIASPLGLKLTSVNNDDPSVKNKKVFDFLSSIEILLIDFSEVFLYQNIEHLEEILSFMNKLPKNNQNIVDIHRIKDTVKDNQLQFMRQSIIISHFKSLEIEMLVKRFCKNTKGGIYCMNEKYENVIDKINLNEEKEEIEDDDEIDFDSEDKNSETNLVKYEFKMLKNVDDMDIYDYKFNYFTKNLWQNLYDTFERHTIIFASSPFDFIRLKSFFKKNSVSVTFISEDTDKKDWQRNRLFFEEGRYKFLLYSERAHFYKKINLKFAKNIFFYSLPEDPSIFKELIELIKPSHYKKSLKKYKIEDKNLISENYSAVIALVSSKMEKYNLEKIVGTNTCAYIVKNKLDNYIC